MSTRLSTTELQRRTARNEFMHLLEEGERRAVETAARLTNQFDYREPEAIYRGNNSSEVLSSVEARDAGFRSTASAFFHCVTRTTNCSTEHDCSLSLSLSAPSFWRERETIGAVERTNFSLQIQKNSLSLSLSR